MFWKTVNIKLQKGNVFHLQGGSALFFAGIPQ